MAVLFIHSASSADARVGEVACASSGHQDDCSPEDGGSPGCCHGLCPTVFLSLSAPIGVYAGLVDGVMFARMDVIPDGPVRDIEYPPQLS